MSNASTNTVRLHRVLATRPEKVYRAFTTADAMARWPPPDGFTCTVPGEMVTTVNLKAVSVGTESTSSRRGCRPRFRSRPDTSVGSSRSPISRNSSSPRSPD